jgi:hypothetical protein
MQFNFAMKRIVLLLIFLATCNSQGNETLDLHWSQTITEQSCLLYNFSRCISYRQVSCETKNLSELVLFEDNEIFLNLEKQCVLYRYIPCQEGWSTHTTVFENEVDFLQRQNVNMMSKSLQCQIDQIREKNESDVLFKGLDEEKQYVNFNLTECQLEKKYQLSLFDSRMENCQTLNETLQEKMVIHEANKTILKSHLDFCLNGGKNTSPVQAELQKCQNITLSLNDENLVCNSEKMKTEAIYTVCLVEAKQESMEFDIGLKSCQDLRDALRLRASNCEAEKEEKEHKLIECQNEAKNNTLFYEAELGKCRSSNNSSNANVLSCRTKQAKLQSDLTECSNEGKKTSLQFKNEIEIYHTSNHSLYENIVNCETEKNNILSNLAKCSNDVLNRTSLLESKLKQLQEKRIVLNDKVLSCNSELTRAKSNFTECLNKQKSKTLWFETERKNCQDARYSIKENIVTCETEKKQVEVNLTRCLIETENTTVEWFTIKGEKFELLANTYNETAYACSIEKKKLKSNLTSCFIDFNNKTLTLQEEIRNYQSLNNSLNENIFTCNMEKSELATGVDGCQLQANNITKLLESTMNHYRDITSIQNENVTSCEREKSRIMLKLTTCLSEQQKDTSLSPAERWNREKNLLIDYMASCWNRTTLPIINNVPSYESINVYIRYNVVRMELSPLTLEEKIQPEYVTVINNVLSFEYYLDIPSCSASSSVRSVFIAVITKAPNFEKRHQIRYNFVSYIKAMAQKIPPTVIHFGFFMGQPDDNSLQTAVEEESDTFGDIVQIEMHDTYRNSPLKMAAVLNWVNINCATVDLVFKMEEEAKITISSIAKFVKTWYTANNSMFGKPEITTPSRGIITLHNFYHLEC